MLTDKEIAEQLIKQIELESEPLVRLGVEEPGVLTREYRINELKRYLAGEKSEWAETEIAAERAFRKREGRDE